MTHFHEIQTEYDQLHHSSKKAAVDIEQVQEQAVRFVAGIKDRGSSD